MTTPVQPKTEAGKTQAAAQAPKTPQEREKAALAALNAADPQAREKAALAALGATNPSKAADDKKDADAQAAGGAGKAQSSAARWDRKVPQRVFGLSPVMKQEVDTTNRPDYKPVQIVFLDGPHANREVDLGLFQAQFSSSQTADIGSDDAKMIRPGAKFNKINPRTSKLELSYWCLDQDVSHLTENLMHMVEIIPDLGRTALLHLQVGAEEHSPVFCTEVSPVKDVPHPGKLGYRQAKVSLSFSLFGGAQSEHQLGKPLAATPLATMRMTETPEQAANRQQAATAFVLDDCLGPEGGEAVGAAVRAGKLGDPATLGALPPGSLTQLAIAGMLPTDGLTEEIKTKLKSDLAATMSATEPGIGGGQDSLATRRFTDALLTEEGTAQLPATLQERAKEVKSDFDKIFAAISDPGKGVSSITPQTAPTALERLTRFGNCGLKLGQTNKKASSTPQADDPAKNAKKIEDINNYLNGNPPIVDIKTKFGLTDDKEAEKILAAFKSAKFTDKTDFLRRASAQGAFRAMPMFDQFSISPATPETPPTS